MLRRNLICRAITRPERVCVLLRSAQRGPGGASKNFQRADYEAIASYYEKIAGEAQQQLEWHESLYKTYKQNPRLSTMQMHCQRLIQIFKNEAREERVMADQYRQLAKKAQ
jgi:hypothetical protein